MATIEDCLGILRLKELESNLYGVTELEKASTIFCSKGKSSDVTLDLKAMENEFSVSQL